MDDKGQVVCVAKEAGPRSQIDLEEALHKCTEEGWAEDTALRGAILVSVGGGCLALVADSRFTIPKEVFKPAEEATLNAPACQGRKDGLWACKLKGLLEVDEDR